jgi:hypothetical protein
VRRLAAFIAAALLAAFIAAALLGPSALGPSAPGPSAPGPSAPGPSAPGPSTFAADPILPDPQRTPGAVLTTDAASVCRPGYAKSVRHTSGKLKARVYRDYGLDRRQGHYEVDHLVSLELGGADVAANLWPESYDTQPWNAHTKDRLENFLHREVCAGRMPLEEAQREIAGNWIDAYRKYFGDAGIAGSSEAPPE